MELCNLQEFLFLFLFFQVANFLVIFFLFHVYVIFVGTCDFSSLHLCYFGIFFPLFKASLGYVMFLDMHGRKNISKLLFFSGFFHLCNSLQPF